MGPSPTPDYPNTGDELSVRPGQQSTWVMPLAGQDRCVALAHEIEDVLHMENGLLVGYCLRCPARFEMPWIRGGTAAELARSMAEEAVSLPDPDPGVIDDLVHVLGLCADDVEHVVAAMHGVRDAMEVVDERVRNGLH